VGSSTEEARSVNGVGFAFEERAQQQRIVGGIVFEVGVLNENEVPGGFLDAAAESSAFTDVARLQEDADLRMSGLEGGENFAGGVGGSVVDADELDVERDGEHAGDDLLKSGLLVVDGHDDGEFHGKGNSNKDRVILRLSRLGLKTAVFSITQ
jgi:hypothetical protein